MLEKNFNGEIFNLAIQNIKIIDLAYQIKNHFKNLDIDIIEQEMIKIKEIMLL